MEVQLLEKDEFNADELKVMFGENAKYKIKGLQVVKKSTRTDSHSTFERRATCSRTSIMWYRSKIINGKVLLAAIVLVTLRYSFVYMNKSLRVLVTSASVTSIQDFTNISVSNLTVDTKPDEEIKHMKDKLSQTYGHNERQDSIKYILVFAYMHTGSTYMGNLLRQHKGSFYHFEPLRDLQRRTLNKDERKIITFLNGTSFKLSGEGYHVTSSYLLHNIFQCEFENIDVSTLTVRYAVNTVYHNDDLGDFSGCTYAHTNSSELVRKNFLGVRKEFVDLNVAARHVKPCVTELTSQCKKSNIRTIKVIRMSKETAELMLKAEPNLRIIHLFRDPRAMLDSNLRKNEMNVKNPSVFRKRAIDMCNTMLKDFQLMETLKSKYPEKILTVRYEDMSSYPMETSELIHNFVDLPFNKRVENFVLAESVKPKKNSTHMSIKWRTHIQQEHLNVVEKNCDELFKTLGYLPLSNIRDVRNLNIEDHVPHNDWQNMNPS
ncbi:hypothetical protein ACF0H5_011195 [Mactra antiquata]